MKLPELTLERRKYLYAVGLAVAGLLLGYGVINADELSGWIALAGALLGYNPAVALRNLADKPADEG